MDKPQAVLKGTALSSQGRETGEDARLVLEIAMEAGHLLLENGAEIFRVEETMTRICRHFGVGDSQFFVLSNGIFTTGGYSRQFAKVQHIPVKGTRLDKVVAVNQLSREIESGKYTPEEVRLELERIRRMPDKPLLFRHMIDIRHHGRNRMHQVIRIVRMVGVRVIRSLMAVYLRGRFLERGEGFIPDGLDEALHGASGGITFLRNLIDAHVRNAAEVLQKELCEHHIDVAFIVGIENRKKRRPRIEPYGIVFSVFPGFLHTYMYIII